MTIINRSSRCVMAGENIRNELLQYVKDEEERKKRWSENKAETKECKAQALAFYRSPRG